MYTINEDNIKYHTGLKALSKYNRLAYKEIILTHIPKLRSGQLIGELSDGVYKVLLPCDDKFKFVYGQLYFTYTFNADTRQVLMQSIEPASTLKQLYDKLLTVKEGVPITDAKALFKVQLKKTMEGSRNEYRPATK